PRSTLFPYTTLFRSDCEELKRAIEARDDFLSIASHELRTPLSTLVLQLETLKHALGRHDLDDKTRQRLDAASRQTLRLGSLIDRSEEHTSELQSPYD